MEFFLDTASLEDIANWQPFGLVQGVTTNPALLSKEGREPLAQLKEIVRAVQGPVSAEVTYDKCDRMIVQGRALSKLADNIVVKVPATAEGFKAASALVKDRVRCNITLTFDPAQAIPFCLLPTTYVSLIIGRVEDFGLRSVELVQQLRDVLDRLKSPTQLLAASIRNSHHLIAALLGKADVITVPPSTWTSIYNNPLTLTGEQDFFRAWQSLPGAFREQYEKLT
jgi:transaldolase